MMNTYEVIFGNPEKEAVTSVRVDAPNEQSAIVEARIASGEYSRRITAIYLMDH